MSVYAVIENSFVTNLIEWDGVSGDFPTAIPNEELGAMIGDVYMNETLYAKPRSDFYATYEFNFETMEWVET